MTPRWLRWLPLALAALMLLAGVAWWRQRDARLRAEGALAAETRQHRQQLDSATAAAARTDTVYRASVDTLHRRLVTYDTLRARVPVFDTSRTVVVDTQFVVAADSVRRACTELEQTCAQRHAADSVRYAALARLAADYRIAATAAGRRRFRVSPALFGGYGYAFGSDRTARPQVGVGLALTYGR